MLIFTAKLNRKKLLAIVILAAFALGALILAAPDKEEAVFGSAKGLKTDQDRLEFIQSLGYEADPQPLRSQQVVIPSQFDQTYQRYNELQKECGFDLEQYQGKTLDLYTYRVTNYPGQQEEVMLDLLVDKNRAAGGAVYSAALDGFMHGLRPAA